MIIALAFVCFAFGFVAAIAVASDPKWPKSGVVGLWNGLRLLRNDVSCIIGKGYGKELLPTSVGQKPSDGNVGLLTKYALPTCYHCRF